LLELKNYFSNLNKLIDEEGNILENNDGVGLLTLDWVNDRDKAELILELLKAFLEVQKAVASSGGGSSSSDSGPGWYELVMAANNNMSIETYGADNIGSFHHLYGDTGMYTGRWQSMDTGGYSGNWYTGEWPNGSVRRNGRLAWLH